MDQNKELVKLVKRNTHFEFLSNGKIRCLLTGHELAPSVSEYNIYLEVKRLLIIYICRVRGIRMLRIRILIFLNLLLTF